jgi:hypothetical protein
MDERESQVFKRGRFTEYTNDEGEFVFECGCTFLPDMDPHFGGAAGPLTWYPCEKHKA